MNAVSELIRNRVGGQSNLIWIFYAKKKKKNNARPFPLPLSFSLAAPSNSSILV